MMDVIEHPLPVFVIGDSHVLPYKNFLCRERWTGNYVVVRSKYISGLSAHDFFDPARKELHPAILDALEYEGLVRDCQATHLSQEELDFIILHAAGHPATPPLILFTVGDIDVRGTLYPLLRDTHDFVPPFKFPYPVLNKPLVPWDLLREVYEKSLNRLISGLLHLQSAGFNRLYVQGVVPPTLDEAKSEKLHGFACPLSVRTKLVATFNRLLADCCSAIGVTCVDIWDRITQDGYLRAEFELDGVHLKPRAARITVETMLDHAINHAWISCNYVRHEMFYRIAAGRSAFEHSMESAE
jgi:hypothetical protein